MRDSISCIIPAYNEGPRIWTVLKVALSSKQVNQVITINDGSSDNTLSEMKKFSKNNKLKIIHIDKNSGKSFAFAKGLAFAKGNIILMLDSDLRGLNGSNIKSLTQPLLNGEADMTLSLRENSARAYKLLGIDFVSGERAFKKNILGNTSEIRMLERYGLEAFINDKFIRTGGKLKVVKWSNVSITRKTEKIGLLRGYIGEIRMVSQIIRAQGLWGVVSQLISLKKLKY